MCLIVYVYTHAIVGMQRVVMIIIVMKADNA